MTMLTYHNDIEESLRKHIYDALLGDIVTKLWEVANFDVGADDSLRSSLLNGCVMITPESMPLIQPLVTEALSRIPSDKEEIEFFIMSDAEPNAYTIENPAKPSQYFVVITSALVNLLSNEELLFVIGHEVGHIKRKDIRLEKLISFVFPYEESIPLVLRHTIRLWRQLAELGADSWGYFACPDFETSTSALNKVVVGVRYDRLQMSSKTMLEYHRDMLEKLRHQPNLSTHPGLSIRISNIDYVAHSETPNQLNEGIAYLAELMLEIGGGDLDRYMALFIATAGLIVAESDGDISDGERYLIYDHLAAYCIFPRPFLDRIAKADVKEVFDKSVKKLIAINPGLRPALIAYMAHMVISDGKVCDKELATLYNLGKRYFGLSRQETSRVVAQMIQWTYIPKHESIY